MNTGLGADLFTFACVLAGVVGLFWLFTIVQGVRGLIETWRGGRGR